MEPDGQLNLKMVDISDEDIENPPFNSPTSIINCLYYSRMRSICISSVYDLVSTMKSLYELEMSKHERRQEIHEILSKVHLLQDEVNKYVLWKEDKTYTRNLIYSDFKNFTILLLCWNAGRSSKIHDHPCDSCFIKVLTGCIQETKYAVNLASNTIIETSVCVHVEGHVSYMDDYIGYHKVANPQTDKGSVSLHIYTPPFSQCKTWDNVGDRANYQIVDMNYCSAWSHQAT